MKGTPSEYKIIYEVHAQSTKNIPNCKPGRVRSRGVMKKSSRRTKGKKITKVARNNNMKSNNMKGNNMKGNNKKSLKKRN